jgi:hypothetical protein
VKKTLVIVLILLAFIAGYFYFNKPQPAQFKGVTNLHLLKISDEAGELRGELVFHNPNKMRSQLGMVNFNVKLNNENIGYIDETFATAIKGGEDFHFAFQIRFPFTADWVKGQPPSDVPVTITGRAGSNVYFANYTFPIEYSGTVKNTIP